jgi:hypothetical protein
MGGPVASPRQQRGLPPRADQHAAASADAVRRAGLSLMGQFAGAIRRLYRLGQIALVSLLVQSTPA